MRLRTAPKTEDVYLLLKREIASGKYDCTGKLPVETVLAEQLGVSRKTLRAALERLAVEMIVERIKGRGTFICKQDRNSRRILVIVGDMEDITNPGRYILPGILEEAASVGIAVDTCTQFSLNLTGSKEVERQIVKQIEAKNYCGILSFSSNFRGDEPIIATLKQTHLPVVLVHAIPPDVEKTGFTVMGTDYPGLVKDALAYLAHLGHRRVAYLAYREHRISREGYFALLREIGLDRDPELRAEFASANNRENIMQDIQNFFGKLKKKPTAVLCFSDYFAVCLYQYLYRNGIRIPEDIAVLSIGGLVGCDFLVPSLSAMDFNCRMIGQNAIRTLLEMIKNKTSEPSFIVTPHHVTERESTRKDKENM